MQNIFTSHKIQPKRFLRQFTVGALSLAAAIGCRGVAAQPATGELAPGRILVMPRAGMPDVAMDKILKQHGGGKARRIGKSELRIVDLPAGSEKRMVEQLRRNPHIEFAEVDRIIAPELVSNDPYLGSQWHLTKIGATTAWDSASGAGVTVAILDTGVDGTHPDLLSRMVPGWNIYDNNANTADVYGHGTKVAGAAAAALNNSIGVAGVAGNAKIMPVRISATNGGASLSAMAQGLTWAADNGARVANISYLCADSPAVLSAASYFKSKGGLVTSAAGNYSVQESIAATTSMIPVSSVDSNDIKAGSSSYGAYVSMSAPGVGIYTTTRGGGYASVSGTSFASPVTAGTIALMMSANAALPNTEIEGLLHTNAVDLGASGRDMLYGYGRVNAAAAVQAAKTAVSTADRTAPNASITGPLGYSTVTGLVPVDVIAMDNVGVTKVELRVNGTLVATDMLAPYAFSWNSSASANGIANLIATAYDLAGNTANSAAVAVNVANAATADTQAPIVVISNPQEGSQVSGVVDIQVSVADDSDLAGIRQTLYVDGKAVASSSGAVLSYKWNTRKASSGSRTIQAVARDAAGNTATRSITVRK